MPIGTKKVESEAIRERRLVMNDRRIVERQVTVVCSAFDARHGDLCGGGR